MAFINAAKKFIQDKTECENKDHTNVLSHRGAIIWDEKDRLPSVSVYENRVEMLEQDKASAESLSEAAKLLNDKINSKRRWKQCGTLKTSQIIFSNKNYFTEICQK